MKKLSVFLVFVILSVSTVSCSSDNFNEEMKVNYSTKDGGGQSGDIKPPPPPPPPCTGC